VARLLPQFELYYVVPTSATSFGVRTDEPARTCTLQDAHGRRTGPGAAARVLESIDTLPRTRVYKRLETNCTPSSSTTLRPSLGGVQFDVACWQRVHRRMPPGAGIVTLAAVGRGAPGQPDLGGGPRAGDTRFSAAMPQEPARRPPAALEGDRAARPPSARPLVAPWPGSAGLSASSPHISVKRAGRTRSTSRSTRTPEQRRREHAPSRCAVLRPGRARGQGPPSARCAACTPWGGRALALEPLRAVRAGLPRRRNLQDRRCLSRRRQSTPGTTAGDAARRPSPYDRRSAGPAISTRRAASARFEAERQRVTSASKHAQRAARWARADPAGRQRHAWNRSSYPASYVRATIT